MVSEQRAEKLAEFFKTLSSDMRVRIVELLRERALCVGAISARLGITQGAVSQHLRILKQAGLVVPEKRGYFVHYRLNTEVLEELRKQIGDFLDTR